MPRKKTIRRARIQSKSKKTVKKNSWFRWGESYSNLLLGIVVVIIAILFITSLIKVRHTQTTSSTSTMATPTPQSQEQKLTPNIYTVQQGDDLWSIAEKTYSSGYNWVDIAKANNLENPDELTAGTKLVLPAISPTPAVQPTNFGQILSLTPTQEQAIKTNTYIIQAGDTLWDIAIRAYADGYKWTQIAKANNLENPDLIFSGNTLQIPR